MYSVTVANNISEIFLKKKKLIRNFRKTLPTIRRFIGKVF